MVRRLAQLLVLLSVLLMPLAMTSPAAAAPAQGVAHSATAMEHCPDEDAMPDQAPGIAACPMACTGALSAPAGIPGQPSAPGGAPRALDEPNALAGLDPESADPPPRLS